jgi:hypothetical protein
MEYAIITMAIIIALALFAPEPPKKDDDDLTIDRWIF